MRFSRALLVCLGCLVGEPSTARAQTPVAPAAPPPPPSALSPQPPAALEPTGERGQWVKTDDSGWIGVPEDSTTYEVDGVPYAYLYTPLYGWTWYASPWGTGPYVYGAWVHRPWPFGFRAWAYGATGWGWRGGTWRGGHFHGGAWHAGGGHVPPSGGRRPGAHGGRR